MLYRTDNVYAAAEASLSEEEVVALLVDDEEDDADIKELKAQIIVLRAALFKTPLPLAKALTVMWQDEEKKSHSSEQDLDSDGDDDIIDADPEIYLQNAHRRLAGLGFGHSDFNSCEKLQQAIELKAPKHSDRRRFYKMIERLVMPLGFNLIFNSDRLIKIFYCSER